MDEMTRTNLANLGSDDRELQNKAFFYVLEVTDKPVDSKSVLRKRTAP
jgi:hypothetical protein